MDLKGLPPLFEDMFIRQMNLLKFIGIDLFNEYNYNPFQRYGRITTYVAFLICMMVGQVMYVIEGNKIGANFVDVVDAIPALLIMTQVFVKTCVFILKKNQIQEIIIEIGKEWPECSDEEKRRELEEWTQKLKLFYNAFFSTAVSTTFIFSVSPMIIALYKFYNEIDAKYELIIQVYYFCELNSNFIYAIVYIHQMVTCVVSNLCVYVSCDCVLVDLIFALSCLLTLEQLKLKNITLHDLRRVRRSSPDDCDDIKEIVKTHQNLLRLAEKLNNIFGPLIFIQVTISSIVISCYGFLAFVMDGMLIRNITCTFGITFAIIVLAWPGQLLIDASSEVAEAAYKCRWYERSNEFRKYISLIIIRSQKPCRLTALGFSDLSIAMFSKVLSTSWSYLSLLHQMYEDDF